MRRWPRWLARRAEQIVFTSGATESNNLAILGTMEAALEIARDAHVISLATEHKSVLEPVRELARRGVATTLLKPGSDGLLDPAVLERAIRPQTRLVSLLHVNNETGVAQDLAVLAAVCRKHGVPLHIDAAQSAGKLPLDVEGIALLSFTAHKLGGPQGVGALFVAPHHRGHLHGADLRRRARTRPARRHARNAPDRRVRPGLRTRGAVTRLRNPRASRALRDQLWRGLSALPDVLLNGHPTQRAPGILNVSFPGVEGEALFMALPDLMLSTGSACNSRSGEPSFVLRALGRDSQLAQSSLRFSLGRDTTAAQIEAAIEQVSRAYGRLRAASPANALGPGRTGTGWRAKHTWAKRANRAWAPGCGLPRGCARASWRTRACRCTAARTPMRRRSDWHSACAAGRFHCWRQELRSNGVSP